MSLLKPGAPSMGMTKILSTYALELVKELGVLNNDNNTN